MIKHLENGNILQISDSRGGHCTPGLNGELLASFNCSKLPQGIAHFRSTEHVLESVGIFLWGIILTPDLEYCKPLFFSFFKKESLPSTHL